MFIWFLFFVYLESFYGFSIMVFGLVVICG